MGRAQAGWDGSGGRVAGRDIDRELAVLDLCLIGYQHPVPPLFRKRVLERVTGIIARTPVGEFTDVSARLRVILRRHGIFCNDLRSR